MKKQIKKGKLKVPKSAADLTEQEKKIIKDIVKKIIKEYEGVLKLLGKE
jgi:DNA replication initiation complex subunit (GINS family)